MLLLHCNFLADSRDAATAGRINWINNVRMAITISNSTIVNALSMGDRMAASMLPWQQTQCNQAETYIKLAFLTAMQSRSNAIATHAVNR
jgi:hypothetical protein